MLKYLFSIIILAHGLIHLMGFAKAWNVGNITQLTKDISKPMGLAWLLTAILFITSIILFFYRNDKWWLAGAIAVIISQILIFNSWKDAKFGTIANIIALAIIFFGYAMFQFESRYKKDVSDKLAQTNTAANDVVTVKDLNHLPAPVQEYLRYAGVVNKPKVKNVKIEFEGQMREKEKKWFPFVSEQYNFFDNYTRLFFMKGKMFGTTVPGYHSYKKQIGDNGYSFPGSFSCC